MKNRKNWMAWVALACGIVSVFVGFLRGPWSLCAMILTIILGLIFAVLARKEPATKNKKFTKFILIFCGVLGGIYIFSSIGLLIAFIERR